MSEVKYNVYYSLSPTGPWTKANSSPISRETEGNNLTIENLKPKTQYYFVVVGGVEIDGEFYEQISQSISSSRSEVQSIDNLPVTPISVRTLSIQTHGGGRLSHKFEIT